MSEDDKLELFILMLNDEELLDEILSFFVEVGVSGATVFESTGMGRILSEEIPIFSGFKELLAGSRPHNRTIMAVVEQKLLDTLAEGIKSIFTEHGQERSGVYFSVPVNKHYGVLKKIESP